MKIVLLSIVLSIIASVITTRFLTLRYFDVIDKYIKKIFADVLDIVGKATLSK